MAINIKNLEEIIQKKAFATSPTTPVSDLSDIVEMALLSTNSIREYDSAGVLPTASTSNAKLAYVKSDRSLRLNTGTKWNSMSSGGAQAGAEEGGGASGPTAVGSSYGYAMGGFYAPTPTPGYSNTVDKFPFSSFTTASDVGDLTNILVSLQGAASATDAYAAGGSDNTFVNPGPGGRVNTIQKIPFASDVNATNNTGTLFNHVSLGAGGIHSSDYAYVAGGTWNFGDNGRNVIQKYSMTTDASGTDVGNLLAPKYGNSGSSSSDYGYSANGYQHPGSFYNTIQKWPFASDGNSADVGDTTSARYYVSGNSSTTHGYSSGGSPPNTNIIEKWSFAADANATDVGNLTALVRYGSGQNSTENGYFSGGNDPSSSYRNVVESFSFSSDGNAVDAGDLSVGRYGAGGSQT